MNRAVTTHRNPSFRNVAGRDFDSLFHDLWNAPFLRPAVSAGGGAAGFVPTLDAVETDTEYRLSAELPGLEEKDFTVEIEEGVLTLKGEKRSRHEANEEGENLRRAEARYGSFERRVRFDGPVDEDNVRAVFRNGVLEVVVPKPEEVRPQVRTVEITTG